MISSALPTSSGLVVSCPDPTHNTGEGLAHFERFLGCADSAGMKNHSLNQIAVFQNVIKNHVIVMKSELCEHNNYARTFIPHARRLNMRILM